MIRISLQQQAFDIAAELHRLRQGRSDIGAIVSFTGLVRDMSDHADVKTMFLEHHPVMTEKQLHDIAAQAWSRWPLLGGTIIHRYGQLKAGDEIVLVATASAHRQAAFESAMFLMDWLKTKAAFWKKEMGDHGARWVAAHASDDLAAAKWQ